MPPLDERLFPACKLLPVEPDELLVLERCNIPSQYSPAVSDVPNAIGAICQLVNIVVDGNGGEILYENVEVVFPLWLVELVIEFPIDMTEAPHVVAVLFAFTLVNVPDDIPGMEIIWLRVLLIDIVPVEFPAAHVAFTE